MKSFEQRPANNLTMENRQTALEAIDEFFSVFHLAEAHEELRTLQETVRKDTDFSSSERCEDLLYFCEKLRELIAAAHQLKQ